MCRGDFFFKLNFVSLGTEMFIRTSTNDSGINLTRFEVNCACQIAENDAVYELLDLGHNLDSWRVAPVLEPQR